MIRWISKIQLKNFKSFKNEIFVFPKPELNKNLVLIGGINGYGKTTLLEALYVGLYGEEAINHKSLDRAGLKAKSYGHFLETAFYRLASDENEDKMEVIIETSRDDDSKLRITRKWFFNGNGKYTDQKLIIEEQPKSENSWKIRPEDSLASLLENFLIPPWLAPFFFFDGEKIATLADEDRSSWISDGLTSLLGVVLVKRLRQHLSNYVTKKMREAGNVNEKLICEHEDRIDKLTQDIENFDDEILETKTKIDLLKSERDRLIEVLSSLAQGGNARTASEVVESRSSAEDQEKESLNKLRKLFSGPLPLQLIRKELFDSLLKTLKSEDEFTAWENGKNELQPRWEQFRKTFFQSDWLKVIAQLPGAKESLEKTLENAWDSLFNPKPINCSEKIWHDYLQLKERSQIPLMKETLIISTDEIRTAYNQYEQSKKKVHTLNQELIRLQGADGETKTNKINQLKKSLEEVSEELEIEDTKLGGLENNKKSMNSELNNLKPVYERERKKLVEGHPERTAAKEAEKVISVIDDLLSPLFELKLKSLSKATTKIFRSLHHKDQVSTISISLDGTPTLKSHEGSEINLPKSSGESQLFVLSLVGALAEVTGYNVPLIVDTPLARLSEKHCNNLINFWVSSQNRQVILLVQDKEITPMDFNILKKNVSKSYLLKHMQIAHGVGKSEAIADSFFEVIQ